MSESNSNNWIPTFITAFTALALLFGVIDYIVYYSIYNFNVFDYIEINEIITHTIKDALFIILPFVGGLLIRIVWGKPHSKRQNPNVKPKSFLQKYLFLILNFLLAVTIIVMCSIGRMELIPSLILLIVLSFQYLFELPIILRSKLKLLFNKDLTDVGGALMFLFLIALYGSSLKGLINAFNTSLVHSSYGDYIIISNTNEKKTEVIKSDSTYYFIGKTNNYVFFYDSKRKDVDIFPEKDILKYSIR